MAFPSKEFTIKTSKDPNIANFFVTYNNKDAHLRSYKLISSLKQQHDLIIEIDSTLTNLPSTSETETAALNALTSFQAMGIDIRHQQSEVKDSKGLFGIFNLNKTYTAHRILAYIPDNVWQDNQFALLLPHYGARYYICKENVDANKMLEDLYSGKLTEEEKVAQLSFIIYDCSDFAQMGIKTVSSKDDLLKLLS
jgi:hypothetical protein